MGFLAGYTTRRKLTIDCTKIDSALSDFPILVALTSARLDFSKANTDGFDIRFTSSDGETLLKYERERHDDASDLAEYWVKVPTIASATDTDIYVYYRTTDTADGADPANTWDAYFGLVYHMKDLTTSTVEDSTSNSFDGTKVAANQPIETAGIIAKGQSFDGSNDRIHSVANPFAAADFTTYGATLECFCKTPGVADESVRYIVSLEGYLVISVSDYDDGQVQGSTSGSAQDVVSTTLIQDNAWYHVAVTWDPSGTPTARLYIDGALEDSSAAIGPGLATLRPFAVGEHSSGAGYFLGLVDEVRISTSLRSAAWMKATNNTGRDTLLTYGDEETPSAPTAQGNFFLLF